MERMESEERIYLTDQYRRIFSATVNEVRKIDDSVSMVFLNRTCFYPESGGQPYDTGTLDGKTVREVREEKGRVAHIAEGSFSPGREVTGIIDFKRRFDHMQQHTGQHLLSRVFVDMFQLSTVGFHMGDSVSTIDLEGDTPSEDILEKAERNANRLIYENLSVRFSNVTPEQFGRISREKDYKPRSDIPLEADRVRLVEVEGVDINACCGTHTGRTGEVGIIKITGTERVRGNTRIEFLCGYRALADYLEKDRIVSSIASFSSTSVSGIGEAFRKLAEENKMLGKEIKSLRQKIASTRAEQLDADGEIGGHSLVKKVLEDVDPGMLGTMAGDMREEGMEIVLLGVGGDKPALVFACSPGIDMDMSEILNEAAGIMDARGGGSRDFARGGGGDATRLKETLDRGEKLVRERLE